MHRRILMAAGAATALAGRVQAQTPPADLGNTLYLDLKQGRVVIQMFPDLAPAHVERIKTLARQGFYDGIVFHRVIEGFMAQGGDPTGTGMSGSKLPNLKAEFTNSRQFLRGVCGMARSADENSANSQFFIMFAPAPALNGKYTIWGQVVKGMEYVDQIKRGAPGSGTVSDPDRIVHLRVASDVK